MATWLFASAAAADDSAVRFGLFAGGLIVPGAGVSAVAGGATIDIGTRERGFVPRIYAVGYHVEDEHTVTNGAAIVAHGTYWFGGVYGLGFGSGLGYAGFTKKKAGGWDDDSLQLIAYFSPVLLRFGEKPTVEIGLNAGATRFIAHDVRPFGYLYVGVIF